MSLELNAMSLRDGFGSLPNLSFDLKTAGSAGLSALPRRRVGIVLRHPV